MIKKIALVSGIIAVILVVGILTVAAFRPDEFRVERSVQVNAPAEKILPLVSDLHKGVDWSPFEKTDPAMKRKYTGAASAPALSTSGRAMKKPDKGGWRLPRRLQTR